MVFLRKYGTGTGADIIIPMIKRGVVDFAVTGDWTPASGDVKVSIDGGATANIGTLPVINGTYGWKFVFADAELQGKSIRVTIVDSATKAVEDQMFLIETYGHASAMYQADMSAANLPANLVQIGGDAQSATDLKDFADAGYNPATHAVILVDTTTNLTTAPASVATAAELAKVPKSDSNVTFNATALASINAQADLALADAGLDNYLAAEGTIDNSLADATTTTFKTDLTAADGAYEDQLLIITSGALDRQAKPILSYSQTNGVIVLSEPLTAAPSNGVTFDIVSDHIHPVSQIQSGLSTHSAADVWAVATRVLTAGTNIQLPANGLANVTAWTVGITGDITGNLSGSVGSVTTKTGFKLASDGLDSISTTAPAGVASNFREMVVQTWRRFFKRTTKSATELKTYADNGTSVLTTQAYTSSGDDDDVGAAT